jgi:hypothetical protein
MIHYHGTPITPRRVLLELGGKCFCVSFASPNDVSCCHQIGQSVMLDCGSFSAWTQGKPTNWPNYYAWSEQWLTYRTTWAIIPDIIGGTAKENDNLLKQWPHGKAQGSPVWHLHEPLTRILDLLDAGYAIISFGSSGEYREVGTDRWHHRMTEAFNLLSRSGPIPWVHMLRGMSLSGGHYPFASVDSTDVARNHNRKNNALNMANRWDALQCPATWNPQPLQQELIR